MSERIDMSTHIDAMGEEIYLVDDVVPQGMVETWWMDIINYGKWVKGFLAYGGNPPHISMNRTGDPNMQMLIREQGGFSTEITGTKERLTYYMNVSRSKDAFKEAASVAYQKADDGQDPYWDRNGGFDLEERTFEHHPKVHQTVEFIWSIYKPYFETALGVELEEYHNCYVHAFEPGDSSWAHQDYLDYSAIVYFNPMTHWDLRKWGGETLFLNDDIDFVRACTLPKGGSAVVFRGDIFHKVTGVSWEAEYPRNSATFFFNKKK